MAVVAWDFGRLKRVVFYFCSDMFGSAKMQHRDEVGRALPVDKEGVGTEPRQDCGYSTSQRRVGSVSAGSQHGLALHWRAVSGTTGHV